MNRFFGMEEILVESLGWWEKEREGRERERFERCLCLGRDDCRLVKLSFKIKTPPPPVPPAISTTNNLTGYIIVNISIYPHIVSHKLNLLSNICSNASSHNVYVNVICATLQSFAASISTALAHWPS